MSESINNVENKLWMDSIKQGAVAGLIFLPDVQRFMMDTIKQNETVIFVISLVIFFIISYLYLINSWLDYDSDPSTNSSSTEMTEEQKDFATKQITMSTLLAAFIFNNYSKRMLGDIIKNPLFTTVAQTGLYVVVAKSIMSYMRDA